MAKSLVKLAKTMCKGKPQAALEGPSHDAIQDYQGAQVQEVPVTEEASDDEEDASWIGSLNMKAALKLEKSILKKIEERTATQVDTDNLQEVKQRLKELRR